MATLGRGTYAFKKNSCRPRVGFTIGPTNTGDMIIRGAYGSFEQNTFTNPPFVNTVALSGGVRLSNPGQGVTAATSGVRAT